MNNNEYKIFENLDGIWDLTKVLTGINVFKQNTPKDGNIDRIRSQDILTNQVILNHMHHPGNIRLILNIYLSKKGQDFSSGGIMFMKMVKLK